MTLKERKLADQAFYSKLVTKEVIENYYKDHSYTELREWIMTTYGCRSSIVDYLLKVHDIHKSKEESTRRRLETNILKYGAQGKRRTPVIDKDILVQLYVVEYLPLADIIERLDNKYSESMIRRNLHDYNITRDKKDNPRYKWTEERRAQQEQTNIERFGCKNPMQNREVIDKSTSTKVERYGEDWGKLAAEKAFATYKERTGLDNPFQDVESVQRGLLEKYGVTSNNYIPGMVERHNATWHEHFPEGSLEFAELVSRRNATKAELYGDPHYNNMKKNRETCLKNHGVECIFLSSDLKYNIKKKYSGPNEAFKQKALKYFTEEEIESGREFVISMKSYDFKLGKYLIEIDPWPTHNCNYNIYGNKQGQDPMYHQEKSKLAFNNGYVCIHVFDWTDIDQLLLMIASDSYPLVSGFEEPRRYIVDTRTGRPVEEETIDTVIMYDDGAVYLD